LIQVLTVPKFFGTYADTFLLLGLALLAERVQSLLHHKETIYLHDRGSYYQIELQFSLNPSAIAALDYWDCFQPVKGKKTDISNLPVEITVFDTVKETEDRKRYQQYLFQSKKQKLELEDDVPSADPRTQNSVILISMRHDRNHNGLWLDAWNLQESFGTLIAVILQAFSATDTLQISAAIERISKDFEQLVNTTFPSPASAVKLYMPTAILGVDRLKADSNEIPSSSKKMNWAILWLIAYGFFEFGLSERVKIAEGSFDWRVVALEPKDISLWDYRDVLRKLRVENPPSGAFGIARFDAETVLKFCQKQLRYHPVKELKENYPQTARQMRGRSIREFASGFSGTHFNSKGQVYGVKELFSLGLPDWIKPNSSDDIKAYQNLLKEHLAVVRSLSVEEGQSELLSAYRDFITSSDRDRFFRFQVSYADYVVKRLADSRTKYPPKQFSHFGLTLMVTSMTKKDDLDLSKIINDPGFLRVARAINSATVYADTIKTKKGEVQLDWGRTYGLAQRLVNSAASKKEFVAELMAFLASYEDENLRISASKGKQLKRIWTRKEDLDRIIALIDNYPPSLIANLLIAYGYAKWYKPLADEPSDTPIDVDEAEDNTEVLTQGE